MFCLFGCDEQTCRALAAANEHSDALQEQLLAAHEAARESDSRRDAVQLKICAQLKADVERTRQDNQRHVVALTTRCAQAERERDQLQATLDAWQRDAQRTAATLSDELAARHERLVQRASHAHRRPLTASWQAVAHRCALRQLACDSERRWSAALARDEAVAARDEEIASGWCRATLPLKRRVHSSATNAAARTSASLRRVR